MGKNEVRKNKEQLKHALRQLRALFDGIDEPIYVSDPKTYEILFANKKLKELAGEKISGKKCYKVFHNLNHPCPSCTNEYIFGKNLGKTYIWEHQNRRNKHWYKCIDKAIQWPGDKHVRFGIAIDITEHKQMEETLRKSEMHHRALIENSSDIVQVVDSEGVIRYVSPSVERILGYKPEELIGRLSVDIVHPDDLPKVAKGFEEAIQKPGVPVVTACRCKHKDGTWRIIEGTGINYLDRPGVNGFISNMHDITERKQAEEKLRSAEQEKGILLDNLVEHVIHEDTTMKILWANQAACESAGLTHEELVGRYCYEVWQNRSTPCPDCPVIKAMETRQPQKLEKTTPDGRSWFIRGYPVLDANGDVAGGIEVTLEITKRKRAEEALRESEELFRSVVENSHDGILIIDDNFRIAYANDEITNIGGRPKEEIIGQDFRKFLDKDEKSPAETLYLRRQKRKKVPSKYELKITRKNGEKRNIEVKSTTIRDSKGRVRTVVQIIDITERKKSEEKIRESEEKYRNLFQSARDIILAFDLKGNVTSTNKAVTEYGFKENELIGKNMLRFISKKYWPRLQKELAKIARGNPIEGKIEIVTPKGKKTVEYRSNPIKRRNKVVGLQVIMRDVTERKHFEDRLSALNKYGQSLNMAESLQDVYRVTLKAMEKTLGFEYASILMVHRKILRLVSQRGYSNNLSLSLPLDGEKGITGKAARTGKPVFVPDIRKEKTYILGKPNMLSELAVPIKVEKEVLGVLNVESKKLAGFDEEDRKLLEILASHAAIAISDIKRHAQLRKLSNRLANLMESSTEIMRKKDTYQRLKVIAKAIRKFGWRRVVISLRNEKLEGTAVVTAGLTKEETKLLLERKASGHVWRERLGPKFQQFKINEFYYLPWSDPWIREYVHHVPPEATLEEATTYAGVPSRLSTEEMVDWHPQDMVYAPLRTPEGRTVGILSMDDPVDGRKPTRESLTPLELFLHQAAIVIENAQLIESLREARKKLEAHAEQLEQKVEERTRELKKSQKQLLKAQRLAVIGELAGMVGHDLRNPLTSINGAAYYVKKRLSSKIDGKVKEMLDLIGKNIVYSNKIINDLLDYSREIKLDITETNPKSIIKEALSLVEIPKNVQVIDLTEGKPKIKVDTAKIKRAFVNILKNAVEAMPKGGTLTTKTRKSDGNLEFVLSDTGVGISKKTMEKLWTPLFTTKAKGMGFGLAICKRVIEAHGGSISVKSSRGKGTTFTVIIPIRLKLEGGEKIWVKPLESSLLTTMKT